MKGFEESKGPSDLTCSHTAHAQKGWRGATGEFPCSRSVRPRKEGEEGVARPPFLLAEPARSECARSMRAVKDSLATHS